MMEIEDFDSQVEVDEELTAPVDNWQDAEVDEELTAPVDNWQDAESALLLAAQAVVERRASQYGQAFDHHSTTAQLWSAYLGKTILPEQVSVMFILDKITRSCTEDKPDHWLDVAGYAAVHAQVQARIEREWGHLR